MIYFPTYVTDSDIHGKALYALKKIPKKSIVMIWEPKLLLSEQEFQALAGMENQCVKNSAYRFFGNWFMSGFSFDNRPEYYLNHSFRANLWPHCGVLIAKQDIQPSEELTIDYQEILPEKDSHGRILKLFIDNQTGIDVIGYNEEQLTHYTIEMIRELMF
jgi:hypothetical protein